jgi:hypothetical protein
VTIGTHTRPTKNFFRRDKRIHLRETFYEAGGDMDSSQRDKKTSMSSLLSGVVDRMLRTQPVAVDDKTRNLAQKQANIRAVSVREGFQSIRARSDEMAERIDMYRCQHAAMIAKRDGDDMQESAEETPPETIVISSSR